MPKSQKSAGVALLVKMLPICCEFILSQWAVTEWAKLARAWFYRQGRYSWPPVLSRVSCFFAKNIPVNIRNKYGKL
jgi:hypothetical protein